MERDVDIAERRMEREVEIERARGVQNEVGRTH
jgi:hypothetical protein